MVFISAWSRLPRILKIVPCMNYKVLNHEIRLCQGMIMGSIGGSGGGSAEESPCDDTANLQTYFRSLNCVWLLQSLNSISLKTNPATGPILPPTSPGNTPLHAPCEIGHGTGLPKPRLSVEQSPCQTEASLQLIGAIQSTAREKRKEKREKRKEKREKRKEKREREKNRDTETG